MRRGANVGAHVGQGCADCRGALILPRIVRVDDRYRVGQDDSNGDEPECRSRSLDDVQGRVHAAGGLVYAEEDGWCTRAHVLPDREERWSSCDPDAHSPARLQAAGRGVLLVRNEELYRLGRYSTVVRVIGARPPQPG